MNMIRLITELCSCAALVFAIAAWRQLNSPISRREKARRKKAAVCAVLLFGTFIAFAETPALSTDVGLAFVSKFMSYGLVDNKDPVVTPSTRMTFYDILVFDVSAIFDTTTYGREAGYSNRSGRYVEFDPSVSLAHAFAPEDCGFLPTMVELSLGYAYEYHPRTMGGGTGEPGDDTQFITFEIALPDLWTEPKFVFERDIDRDNGTYVNLELGHSFELIDSFALRPSVAQGLGNTSRIRGYGLAEDHGGLMDACVMLELIWNLGGGTVISVYGAYYDYIFDSTLRDGARAYEATGRDNTSYHFVGGMSVCASF